MRATKGRGPRRGQHPSRGMEREIDSQWERDSEGRRGGKRETQSGMERARDSEGGGVGARLRVERERDSEWELQASKRAVIKYRMAIFLFGENQSVVTRSRTAQPHCIAALLSRAALPHCVAALRRRTGGTPIFPGRLLRLRGRGLHSPLPLTLLPYPSRPSLLSLSSYSFRPQAVYFASGDVDSSLHSPLSSHFALLSLSSLSFLTLFLTPFVPRPSTSPQGTWTPLSSPSHFALLSLSSFSSHTLSFSLLSSPGRLLRLRGRGLLSPLPLTSLSCPSRLSLFSLSLLTPFVPRPSTSPQGTWPRRPTSSTTAWQPRCVCGRARACV